MKNGHQILPSESDSFSLEQLAAANIHLFLEYYGITNDQGTTLDFKEHPYLWEIYEDWTPQQCIKKSAQVGLSTTVIIKSIYAAWTREMDVIYSFPTYDLARKMVSSKVNRLIAHNHIFKKLTKDQDSIEQKRIGRNMLYFQGTSNEQAAIALPADLYISDETDRSDQHIVEQFASRLQHSKFGWEWRFSNPSVPGNGVDVWWEKSDQKEWFVSCGHCFREQILSVEHIRDNTFVCEKCGSELDRTKGRWVPKWRDEPVSGYHISTLMNPHISADTILALKKDKSEQYFSNFVLGEPYVGGGNYLPKNVIFANLSPRENPQDKPIVIGVDTGKLIHFVAGNEYGLFYAGEANDYAPIEAILRQHPTSIAVIDQGGDITAPRALQEKYQGRVYLCTFVQSSDVAPKWKEPSGMVNVDRNKAIQLLVDEFTEKRIPLFGGEANWEQYAEHWSHLYRELEEDERGRRRYIWKRNGADHLALASVYWRVGIDKVVDGAGELITPQEGIFPTLGMELGGAIAKAHFKRF